MIVAHHDARYAAALATVDKRIAALDRLRLPRCAGCGTRFVPGAERQRYCHAAACDRLRGTQAKRRWRAHLRALHLDRTPLGRDLVCGCGARLEVEIQAGGVVVDRCPRCGALTPTRRGIGCGLWTGGPTVARVSRP